MFDTNGPALKATVTTLFVTGLSHVGPMWGQITRGAKSSGAEQNNEVLNTAYPTRPLTASRMCGRACVAHARDAVT